VRACASMSMCICICVKHVCLCVCLYMYVCVCMHMLLCVFTHTSNVSVSQYICLCRSDFSFSQHVYRVDWIEWQGNKYCVDDIIWCGQEDELPKFGKLIGILIVNSSIFFALNFYVTKGTDRHHKSIVVEISTSKFHLEPITEESQWIGKQHSFVTHTLPSSKPGTCHVVTKYILTDLS